MLVSNRSTVKCAGLFFFIWNIRKYNVTLTLNNKTCEMELKAIKLQLNDGFGNDLLKDNCVGNLMQEATSKLVDDISKKRYEIISKRLKEIVGVDLNFEEETSRRFKRLAIVYNNNEETIYFNDGSISGVRIVTFIAKQNPLSFDSDKFQMSTEYSYY